jgi:hypothetical protein
MNTMWKGKEKCSWAAMFAVICVIGLPGCLIKSGVIKLQMEFSADSNVRQARFALGKVVLTNAVGMRKQMELGGRALKILGREMEGAGVVLTKALEAHDFDIDILAEYQPIFEAPFIGTLWAKTHYYVRLSDKYGRIIYKEKLLEERNGFMLLIPWMDSFGDEELRTYVNPDLLQKLFVDKEFIAAVQKVTPEKE